MNKPVVNLPALLNEAYNFTENGVQAGWTCIETPFLDAYDNNISLYVSQTGEDEFTIGYDDYYLREYIDNAHIYAKQYYFRSDGTLVRKSNRQDLVYAVFDMAVFICNVHFAT